jgi:hypothetical protein
MMDTFLSIMARAYEFDRIREFYRTIMEEIAAESPACAARIAGRMEDLNARQGFTYAPIGTMPGAAGGGASARGVQCQSHSENCQAHCRSRTTRMIPSSCTKAMLWCCSRFFRGQMQS